MTTEAIVLIIGAASLGIVNIITAFRVTSAASTTVTTIESLRAEVLTLTQLLAKERARK